MKHALGHAAGRGGGVLVSLGAGARAGRLGSHRGGYRHSSEQLTPVLRDPPSLVPIATVATRLLCRPGRATTIAASTVDAYRIGPGTIATVRRAVAQRSA
jgi:hypothetical protein